MRSEVRILSPRPNLLGKQTTRLSGLVVCDTDCDITMTEDSKRIRSAESNPPTNIIPEWVNHPTLIDAIEKSGYPLQGVVAEKLKAAGFDISEEWGFLDKETNAHRSLDLIAWRKLADDKDPIDPRLELLIECKRSVHPYVFFRKVSDHTHSIFR